MVITRSQDLAGTANVTENLVGLWEQLLLVMRAAK